MTTSGVLYILVFFLALLAPFLEPVEHQGLLKKVGGPGKAPFTLWVNDEIKTATYGPPGAYCCLWSGAAGVW